MANEVTVNGLVTDTRAELLAFYTTAYQTIYGADINLDQDSPDGQMMNIQIQAILDLLDLVTQVYNGFDPDLALGKVLDQRVAINGIQRQAGTFTTTNITIVVNQALSLNGLDQDDNPVYTISDNAGNLWELVTSQNFVSAGSYVVAFQSAVPGEVLTTPNTITVPVSIVLGVVSVNNPTTLSSLGINEETDAELKIRRQKSVSLASQGYLAGLLAALENISGVTSAFVYENTTDTTDGDGIPGHSIWVIVAGSGAPADIGNAIYTKRNAGAGMFGSESYVITQVDGTFFPVYWDDVEVESMFIRFTVTSLDGVNDPQIANIRAALPALFEPGVNAEVNINQLATYVQQIDPNTLVTLAGFSTAAAGPYTDTLQPSAKNKQFTLVSADIIILDMILYPKSSTVVNTTGTVQFSAVGGFGAYTYSIFVNNSGGTISPTGLYTAGATPGTDTVRVTDTQSHTADATVVVTA